MPARDRALTDPPLSKASQDKAPEGPAGVTTEARLRSVSFSPSLRFLTTRLALLPVQLLFVLLLLYIAIDLPIALHANPHLTLLQFFDNLWRMVVNIFTGNWGPAPPPWSRERYPPTYFQLLGYYFPNSIQLAIFGLLISVGIAYPLGLALGWIRRPANTLPVRAATLGVALLPAYLVAWLVILGLFYPFFNTFHDVDSGGLTPSITWIITEYNFQIPSWVIADGLTRPTGLPLIDAALHGAWQFELISFVKTVIQASVIALAYVGIFLRQARSMTVGRKSEPHIVAARARGVPERTLLWHHVGRSVLPSFALVFALTIPAYLLLQFLVEAAFSDPGFGSIVFLAVTWRSPEALEGLIFLLSAFVLVAVLIADLIANRLDPRGIES